MIGTAFSALIRLELAGPGYFMPNFFYLFLLIYEF